MHVIMTKCHICNADLVSEIRSFCLKIESFSGRKYIILARRGVDMLSDASAINHSGMPKGG